MEANSADVIRSPDTPLDWVGADVTPDLVTEPAPSATELFQEHHLELVRLALLMVSDLVTYYLRNHQRGRHRRNPAGASADVTFVAAGWCSGSLAGGAVGALTQ